jgi:uncharacterized protein (DUF2235 family)
MWDRPSDLKASAVASKTFKRQLPHTEHLSSPPTTNVLKLYQSISPRAQDGCIQQKWYASGTEMPWFHRFRPGAFGYGLDQTILQGYAYLIVNYEPGDELFIYGFSRGAYVARTLVGWISLSGLLSSALLNSGWIARVRKTLTSLHRESHSHELAQCLTEMLLDPSNRSIDDAYRRYRNLHNGPHTLASTSLRQRGTQDVPVTLLGIWDTVGPLGIPTSALKWLNEHLYNFHDTELSPIVKRAYHALALDEHRADYNATLWTSSAGTGQTIEQCWFSGAHGDIGGSYHEQELADISLAWIQQKSLEAGLWIEKHSMPQKPNPFGPLHDSFVECLGGFRKWFHSRFYRPVMQTGTNTETLDESIRVRLLHNSEYRPNNEGLQSAITFRR